MLGCNSVCPNCKHQFQCCGPFQPCCNVRRSLHVLSGGGLVALAPPSSGNCSSPQVSPSLPLAFILPAFNASFFPPGTPVVVAHTDTDQERLSNSVLALSQSGFYYDNMSFQEAHELLAKSEPGTFLVRNSSDSRFLFSLSVQTERGPTSVRLCVSKTYFRLDALPHIRHSMPLFATVLDLVEHYVRQTKLLKKSAQVWVDPHGSWYSAIMIEKPLRRKPEPPSLKHFARLTIHRAMEAAALPKLALLPPPYTQLELPSSLIAYLSEYPYTV